MSASATALVPAYRSRSSFALSSLALLGITAAASLIEKPQRILACNMTKEQRGWHEVLTTRLLYDATRKEFEDGYQLTSDRARVSIAQLAEWWPTSRATAQPWFSTSNFRH